MVITLLTQYPIISFHYSLKLPIQSPFWTNDSLTSHCLTNTSLMALMPRCHTKVVAVITLALWSWPPRTAPPNKTQRDNGAHHAHNTALVLPHQTSPCQYFPRNNFHHVICATKSNQRRSQSLILVGSGGAQCVWPGRECGSLFWVNEMYSWRTLAQMDYTELFTGSDVKFLSILMCFSPLRIQERT